MLLCKCMRAGCPNPHWSDTEAAQNPHGFDIVERLNRNLLPLFGNTGAGLELNYEETGNDGETLGGGGA